MYNYSPETCLIQDTDGKIYNIIDLWNGIKTPVDLSTLQYNYSPRSCLVRNVDGADVNVIDTILAVANGSGSGTSSLEEVIRARGKYSTLGERLDKENEKVYETINGQDYIPFEGENIKVEHSKIGYTKDMKLYGRTLQNFALASNYVQKQDGSQAYFSWDLNYSAGQYTVKNTTGKKIVIDINKDNKWVRSEMPTETSIITLNEGEKISNMQFLKMNGFVIDDNIKKQLLENLVILKGNYLDIIDNLNYFEGIKSVGEAEGNKISILTHGKNFFDVNKLKNLDLPAFKIIDEKTNTFQMQNSLTKKINLLDVFNIDKANKKGLSISFNLKKLIDIGGVSIFQVEYQDGTSEYVSGRGDGSKITKKITKPLKSIYFTFTNGGETEYSNVMFNEGEFSEYEPYKQDKKEILLPFEGGLKGLPSKAKDEVIIKDDGVYIKQNIGKVILESNSQTNTLSAFTTSTHVCFLVNMEQSPYNLPAYPNKVFGDDKVVCDKLPSNAIVTNTENVEGVSAVNAQPNYMAVKILKSKLETPDTEGFKKWLQANPITVYYELAEPIEHKIVDLNTTNLETYKDVTHVSSENGIQPNLSFKAPVDVQATISMLRENNARLSGEVDNKTKELQAKDEYLMNENDLLTAKDLDMDFRIFELEEQLMPEVAKLSSNYNSPYSMIERCIERGLYEKEDMLYKMGRYFHGNRLTQEEYDKLKLMMG